MDINLLIHYIANETTSEQNIAVKYWCEQDVSHRKQLEDLRTVWNMTGPEQNLSLAETAASLIRFKEKVAVQQGSVQQTAGQQAAAQKSPAQAAPLKDANATLPLNKSNQWNYWLKVAAIFVGIPMMIWFYLIQQKPREELTASTTTKTDTTLLADGSVVVLNKNSSLKYPESFSGGTRTVNLIKGEAFFKVSHDPRIPFYVLVNGIQIKVIGTAFNVKTKNNQTEIIVESGKVRVSKKKEHILLTPLESILIGTANTKLHKEKHTDMLYNYYRSKEFIASGTPLYKLAEVLDDAYDVHISFDKDHLKYLPMSTTFKDESLDDILSVISRTFNLKVTKNGPEILFKMAN